ncbi:MAG: hypothetical protein ACTSYB_13995 [Candidatus Helarchaeota archaeon]
MPIVYKSKNNNIDYVAIQIKGKDYLFRFNSQTNSISLFSGHDLIKKFLGLIKRNFDGCIECSLTLSISKGISKESGIITKVDMEKNEANQVINEINEKLGLNYPFF